MKRAARTDANQNAIVNALRGVGASVQILSMVGSGCVDLLIGFRSVNYCAEVKSPDQPLSNRQLTKAEKRWHAEWRGQRAVIETPDDALRMIGVL